jgi:hypothetical protein
MAKRRMLFLALAVAVLVIFAMQLQRQSSGGGALFRRETDSEGRVRMDPSGTSNPTREDPPIRIEAAWKNRELEIVLRAREALADLHVIVQRFDAATAATPAAVDTVWTGNLAAGSTERVKAPQTGGVRYVISARGADAAGGRVAATTIVQP